MIMTFSPQNQNTFSNFEKKKKKKKKGRGQGRPPPPVMRLNHHAENKNILKARLKLKFIVEVRLPITNGVTSLLFNF